MTRASPTDDENSMYSLSFGWERVGVRVDDDEIPATLILPRKGEGDRYKFWIYFLSYSARISKLAKCNRVAEIIQDLLGGV
jgi:hypothetical protein